MAAQNIYQQFQNPVRSVADYAGDMDKQEQNKLTLAAARLSAQQAQQGMADDQAARQAAINSGGDSNKMIAALNASGNYKAAQAYQKQLLDNQKTQADTGLANAHATNFGASTAKTAQETKYAAAANFAQNIDRIRTPQDVQTYFNEGIKQGVFNGTLDQFMQQANQYPTLEAWKAAEKQAAVPILDRYKVEAENARNAATVGASIENNKRTTAQQERNSQRVDERTREFNDTKVEENNIKRSAKDEEKNLTKNSQIASFDTMLGTLDRLSKHPGLPRSVGKMSVLPTMPGSDSANFQAELNTFQSQAFLPMVAQLKGMGALSDAEGKKLTAAVGALDPKMGEKAFRDSIGRITKDMDAARERMTGKPKSNQPTATKSGASVSNW